jgi:hemerythrin superfamily protein
MTMISNMLTGSRQDVVSILEADHRAVEKLFKDIQAASGSRRSSLVDKLVTELTLHMSIEESLVYPRVSAFDKEMSQEAKAEHALAKKVMTDMRRLAPDEPGFDGALGMLQAGIEHHVQEEEGELFPKLRRELDQSELERLTDEVEAAKQRGRAPRRASSSRKRTSSASKRASSASKRTSSAQTRASSASKRTSAARTRGSSSKATSKPRTSRSTTSRGSARGRSEPTKDDLVRRAKRAGVTGYSRMNKRQLERALAR